MLISSNIAHYIKLLLTPCTCDKFHEWFVCTIVILSLTTCQNLHHVVFYRVYIIIYWDSDKYKQIYKVYKPVWYNETPHRPHRRSGHCRECKPGGYFSNPGLRVWRPSNPGTRVPGFDVGLKLWCLSVRRRPVHYRPTVHIVSHEL